MHAENSHFENIVTAPLFIALIIIKGRNHHIIEGQLYPSQKVD